MFRAAATLLVLVTALSIFRVAFHPPLPKAGDPRVDLQAILGNRKLLLDELPGHRSLNWSLSTTRRYQLPSLDDRLPSPSLQLLVTGVVVRREEHLQVALVTSETPFLAMEQRTVHKTQAGDEYALGTIGGFDALQSCRVPRGQTGVTAETLGRFVVPAPFFRQEPILLLERFMGLRPDRDYRCDLVTIIWAQKAIGPQNDDSEYLVSLWRHLLDVAF